MNNNRSQQQRFTKGMRKMIGIGTSYKKPGYIFPTHKQMDVFDQFDIPYDVDEQLRDVVIELNELGFKTGGSCSGGHQTKNSEGFITILLSHFEIHELSVKHQSSSNKIHRYAGLHGTSNVSIDVPLIKTIIQKHIGNVSVRYKQPTLKYIALFHSFTFPKLTTKLRGEQV
jgi:hypothetical protein